MLTFLLVALALLIVTVVILIRPLTRKTQGSVEERRTQNIEYAREQLAEIDLQLADATISEEDYQELKQEIEARLASDIDLEASVDPAMDAQQTASAASNAVLITLLCCLVPILAGVTYLVTGDPAAVTRTAVAQEPASASEHDQGGLGTDINQLVQSLEQRLKTNGDDIQGWTILARTYRQLGRFTDAVAGYRRLNELQPNNPDHYAGLAEAISAARNGVLNQEARDAVARVLELNDKHAQGLWLAGMGELQAGNNQQAIEYWKRLRVEMEGYPEQQAELDRVIQETAADGGQLNGSKAESAEVAQAAEKEQPEAKPSDQAADEAATVSIRVRAELDPSVAEKVNAGDTVFIIARAQNGPPAPLAVKRLTVADLPISVTLTPADAMLPQLSIATFPQLELVARVSKTGQPITQPGDIQSDAVATSNTASDEITLTINSEVQ